MLGLLIALLLLRTVQRLMARRDKSKVSEQFYRTGNTNHRQ